MILMKKHAIFLALGMLSAALPATADDGATLQSLGNTIGATDAYRINCQSSADPAIGATHHLNFKILDTTPDASTGAPPQLLNVHVKKGNNKTGFVTHDEAAIAPGEKGEFYVAAGVGSYAFVVDTEGTNASMTTPQSFTIETHCLNDDGQLTKPALARVKSKSIKNGKKIKLSVACSKSKQSGATTKLFVKFANTTVDPARVVINAQVIKDSVASNTTDGGGDDVFSEAINLQGGNGDYTVLVNDTAFDPQDNAREYTMAYRCENGDGVDTGGAEITQTQDQ